MFISNKWFKSINCCLRLHIFLNKIWLFILSFNLSAILSRLKTSVLCVQVYRKIICIEKDINIRCYLGWVWKLICPLNTSFFIF